MIKNTEGGLLDYKKNAFTFSSTCDSTGWNQIQESPCLHCQSAWRRSRRAIERRQREQNQYFYRSSSLGLVRVDVTWSPFLSLSCSPHWSSQLNWLKSELSAKTSTHPISTVCHGPLALYNTPHNCWTSCRLQLLRDSSHCPATRRRRIIFCFAGRGLIRAL